jgi:hypothetical protein
MLIVRYVYLDMHVFTWIVLIGNSMERLEYLSGVLRMGGRSCWSMASRLLALHWVLLHMG